MSAPHRKSNRAKSAGSQKSSVDARESFFANLKDMNELLGVWTLGAALTGAGFSIASSEFAFAFRLAGLFVCVVMGLMVIVSSVMLFSRDRFAINGQPVREKIKRLFKFAVLMTAGLTVCVTTVELLQQTTPAARTNCGGTPPSTEPTHKEGEGAPR